MSKASNHSFGWCLSLRGIFNQVEHTLNGTGRLGTQYPQAHTLGKAEGAGFDRFANANGTRHRFARKGCCVKVCLFERFAPRTADWL